MTNKMILGGTSNLVMPLHYVELDSEEMCYVAGGYDRCVTYTGKDAENQIWKYAGYAAISIGTMVGSAMALCATAVTVVGAIASVISFIGAFFSSILNIYNVASALVYYCKYGSFTAREYGWWVFDFVTVIGK